ncbi:hypothetical protein HID58_079266 [Brassica napus]|uniref:Uncharacterized protein n=1 Tax=Brassica napus TaxID=3708 RepID=A0ABQ7Y1J3_BRANA|nr:hypothetical protein HID58_079266 [Brassica napus]
MSYLLRRLKLSHRDVGLRPYEGRGSIQLGVEIGFGDSLSRDFKDESTSPIDLLPHRRFSADSNPNEVCVPPSSSDLDDFVVIDDLYPPFLGSVMAKAPPEISRTNRHPQSICCLIDASPAIQT